MTPGERYRQTLAAMTPHNDAQPVARSLEEIDGAGYQAAGKISSIGPTTVDAYGSSLRVKGKMHP